MTDNCRLPEFTDRQAARHADELYGLEGRISRLDGERDLNFRIDRDRGPVVFKIANATESLEMLNCQQAVFERISQDETAVSCPRGLKSKTGRYVETIHSASGARHYCRAAHFMEGRLFSEVNPHTPGLLESLGSAVGGINRALDGFSDPALERPLLWKMDNALEVIERFRPLVQDARRGSLLDGFARQFQDRVLPLSGRLRKGVIHNDANDHNLIVSGPGPWDRKVSGILDFGDMVNSWIAVDPAVAAAYSMLGKAKPLDAAVSVIRGYHQACPLNETEISVLFELVCMRLCMSVSICAHQQSQEPGNEYLRISEKPAWQVLEPLSRVSRDFVHFLFRDACALEPVPDSAGIVHWIRTRRPEFKPIVEVDLQTGPLLVLDLGVGSPHLPDPSAPCDAETMTRDVFRRIEDSKSVAGIGKYDEYRLVYDTDDFTDATGHRRTLHLGMDIFMPAGSPVFAPWDGTVFAASFEETHLGYGGTLILRHTVTEANGAGKGATLTFHTLFGHLSFGSIAHLKAGQPVSRGQKIAEMGDASENGHWPPHVHFQLITHMLDETETFVGVGSHAYRNVWLSLCPDPNGILGIPGMELEKPGGPPDMVLEKLQASRRQCLGPSLSLSYGTPIHLVRGSMQYLYDFTGRRYLDAVNNVPHVGHCHPRVVAAERAQSGVLNTNTRYLYSAIQQYSERLLDRFPDPLEVCFLVNSGSEANDLALRLARNFTGRQDVWVLDHAYHGNLSSLIEISPYKHDGPGGSGTPAHVHKMVMPDRYRGRYRAGDPDAAGRYIDLIGKDLSSAEPHSGPAAFICESILGCGGQVFLPEGYLKGAYARVREAGGLCIADEVQVGFGRIGSHFWAFEAQDVVPDVVTLGKPMGNGHPMAAVIVTREVADAFHNGMEYFNTFGGNPVSCAIGNAVLDAIEQDGLQHNAREVGVHFLNQLMILKNEFELIGDVRGRGLFLGVELVNDRISLDPAADQAHYIAERMKQEGILISTDGPLHNVLKIKPPLCFAEQDVNVFVQTLESILCEDCSKPVERSGGPFHSSRGSAL
ncbi:MAG: aminotransferase class III-fold pyridoxal phosphate-dependent enzyme [Gammaproteobacteria bacterium]|nr:aminotransferase class III-fold pyridoxal phosphate-dependent enzyme [Gammaproteobacteria bacterium]